MSEPIPTPRVALTAMTGDLIRRHLTIDDELLPGLVGYVSQGDLSAGAKVLCVRCCSADNLHPKFRFDGEKGTVDPVARA